jgi:hypothetical protein
MKGTEQIISTQIHSQLNTELTVNTRAENDILQLISTANQHFNMRSIPVSH